MILFELDRLKSSIDEALQASLRPPQGFSHSLASDSRVARNLRNLAQAARQFHSAASSTASTVRERSGSLLGDFPAYRRERVETFIRSAPHGPVAAGHDTPTATARAVSPPPDSVRAPQSPPVASPEPLRVTTQSPRWSVVEDDDEDDEAEFESQFLDGLEDLAKDSIRRKFFYKAIEHLTEAIQRKEKAAGSKEDIRRLQTLLALCHFFCDDWKQAEPIVTALAKPTGSLSYVDPMVWTMLHALALAHLSTYTFDSALKTCKRAIQAQRRWARRQGLDRRNLKGCAETTGLLATIFDMKGDYIAAEIYRRQQPEHFVYHHCANPREFLSGQRDLLEGLLGDDLPDFCDNAPVNGLPGVQALHGATTSPAQEDAWWLTPAGGDWSPLRATSYQWEKVEMDTAKEVVVPKTDSSDESHDGDDEAASTAPDSPHDTTGLVGLRRTATRIFGTVRAGRYRPSGSRDAGDDSGPSSPAESPIRRWFRPGNVFAVKPSKTVLRKRPSHEKAAAALDLHPNRPRTFRVLNVVHVTGATSDPPKAFSSNPEPSVPAELCDTARVAPPPHAANPPPRTRGGEVSDNFTSRNGVLYVDPVPRRRTPENQLVAPQAPVRLQQSVIYTRLPELPDTSFSASSRARAPSQANLVNVLRYYSLISPDQEDAQPSSRAEGEMSHLALPPRNGSSQMTALEARATLLEADHSLVSPGPDETSKVGSILARGGLEMLRRTAVPRPSKHPTAALPEEVATTLSRVASILVSLPEARKSSDTNKLHATRHELEALSNRLERWSADALLHCDLQTVIESLPCESARLEERQDSGYESMGQESSSEYDTLSEEEDSGLSPATTARHEDGKNVKLRNKGLQRRSSWVAGDEAVFVASPVNVEAQDPIPHAKDSLVMDSGKQAEGDSDRDPTGGDGGGEATPEAEVLESNGRVST
jgi:hypothetical protein